MTDPTGRRIKAGVIGARQTNGSASWRTVGGGNSLCCSVGPLEDGWRSMAKDGHAEQVGTHRTRGAAERACDEWLTRRADRYQPAEFASVGSADAVIWVDSGVSLPDEGGVLSTATPTIPKPFRPWRGDVGTLDYALDQIRERLGLDDADRFVLGVWRWGPKMAEEASDDEA